MVSIEDKMQETRLRWFKHVQRICAETLVQRCVRADWIVSTEVQAEEVNERVD